MQIRKRFISYLLILSLCLSLTACIDISGYLPSTQEPTEDGLTTYHITVRTHSGQYLKDIGVRVFADTTKTDLVWYDKTDAKGQMTFIADTFDGYVVALENVPDGYTAADHYTLTGESSEIVLSIGLQTGVDLNTVRLNLGDPMVNLTVNATDGVSYDLSEQLASKKAAVLCFFDSGSAEDLSVLQQAWMDYRDEVAVLALNPLDDDVSSYAQGLSLPIAACESAWISALDLRDYPAMVVVDRYGIISLIHGGRITDADIYRDVFAFFARNDYAAEVVENIEDIVGKSLEGTQDNPIFQDGSADIMASVEPGGMIYYSISRVFDMLLQIRSANAVVIYEGQTYYPENGVITLMVHTPDPFTPVSLGIGNTGSHTELFVARFSYQPGTVSNPHVVDLGQIQVSLEPGDENGQFYTYKAIKPGVLLLQCTQATEEVPWIYTLTNRNSGSQVSSEEDLITDELTGLQYLLLPVSANDVVLLSAGTVPDPETGEYPGGSFTFQLSYEGDSDDDPVIPPTPGVQTTYTMTVIDSYGTPLPGVSITFSDATGSYAFVTDASGAVSYTNTLGSVQVTLVPLRGYTAPKTEFTLTTATNNVSAVFTGTPEGEYTQLPLGNAYHVFAGENYAVMHSGASNYFLFTPTQAGMYRFAAGAQLSYWGTDINAPTDLSAEAFQTADGFTLNIPEELVGVPHILGMTGVPYTTLIITRVGEVAPDPETFPITNYVPKHMPYPFTYLAEEGKLLRRADITAALPQLVYDPATGFYRKDSVDGPIIYVNLGIAAPYLSLAKLAEAPMLLYRYDENGYLLSKVDLAPCVQSYAACMDTATGLYPLTEDLVYVLQTYGNYAGWYDATSPAYLFMGEIGIKKDSAWAFALCWAE